jgi:hypothetical protein
MDSEARRSPVEDRVRRLLFDLGRMLLLPGGFSVITVACSSDAVRLAYGPSVVAGWDAMLQCGREGCACPRPVDLPATAGTLLAAGDRLFAIVPLEEIAHPAPPSTAR